MNRANQEYFDKPIDRVSPANDAFLVFAGWGPFESGCELTTEWFNDGEAARSRYDNVVKCYRGYAEDVANIERASNECFYAALLHFPFINVDRGYPDELSDARLRTYISATERELSKFVIRANGLAWSEAGVRAYPTERILEDIADIYG